MEEGAAALDPAHAAAPTGARGDRAAARAEPAAQGGDPPRPGAAGAAGHMRGWPRHAPRARSMRSGMRRAIVRRISVGTPSGRSSPRCMAPRCCTGCAIPVTTMRRRWASSIGDWPALGASDRRGGGWRRRWAGCGRPDAAARSPRAVIARVAPRPAELRLWTTSAGRLEPVHFEAWPGLVRKASAFGVGGILGAGAARTIPVSASLPAAPIRAPHPLPCRAATASPPAMPASRGPPAIGSISCRFMNAC